MRKDLWAGRPSTASQVKEGRLYEQAQSLLQPSPQTTIDELKPVVKQLRSRIVKKPGPGPMHIVIGVPVFFTYDHRRELRMLVLEQLGRNITVLATLRQSALARVAFDLHTKVRKSQDFTVLIVDYNHASLDISFPTTEVGVTGVMAYTSLPLLGEDFLHLRLATFVHQHTCAIDDASFNNGIWKPAASDLSQILISGDASSQGFEQLRKAIATKGGILVRLQDPGLEPGAPSSAWVSAEGAAKNVGERRIDRGDADWNWAVHNEL
ncbi:MAG: hypothetical protein Q9209_001726 [Squamulea sp. 1 TL-2023]